MNVRILLTLALSTLAACGSGKSRPPPTNACDPNPCTEARKNLCVVEDGNARCLCNAGFVSRPNGTCEELSANNCPEHPGDAEEPDDCQARARQVATSGESRSRSISPTGDYDFFKFDTTVGNIYAVTVTSQSALYPRVDVFDQGGLHVGFAERLESARFSFKSRATAPYFARISHSPLDPSVATGDYAFSVTSAGSDDAGDDAANSVAMAPDLEGQQSPRIFTGRFEYGNDQDWYNFTGTLSTRYTIAFDASRDIPTVAVYSNATDESPLFVTTQPTVEFYVEQNGTAYVAMYPTLGEGSYAFTFLRE